MRIFNMIRVTLDRFLREDPTNPVVYNHAVGMHWEIKEGNLHVKDANLKVLASYHPSVWLRVELIE